MKKQDTFDGQSDRPFEREDTHMSDRASGRAPTEFEIQAWLISKISAVVEVSPQQINIRKPFEQYGMDSMQAMRISTDIEDWLGRQVSPTAVWDYPTIELLARHLARDEQSRTNL